jgi:radical SAM superfamily enzyme YgiQ (UPF0313 family)
MVRRVIPMVSRRGIRPVGFFILGFPWEDPAATETTLQLMKELSPYIVFKPAIASILIPFPGTELYDRYKDEYDFTQWWTGDERAYDVPTGKTHPFYQTVMYRMGMVLDADFFRYSPQMKAKIHDVFRFMYASNFRRRNIFFRTAAMAAIDLSRRLESVSPQLERLVFKGPLMLRSFLQRMRGQSVA